MNEEEIKNIIHSKEIRDLISLEMRKVVYEVLISMIDIAKQSNRDSIPVKVIETIAEQHKQQINREVKE